MSDVGPVRDRILSSAHYEAARLNHSYIGTEHILLALLAEGGEPIVEHLLAFANVTPQRLRDAVEFVVGHGAKRTTSTTPLTPRAKRVLELAVDEVRREGPDEIGPEHVLVGLVREGEGIAAGVLEAYGLSVGALRHEIASRRRLGSHPSRARVDGTTRAGLVRARTAGAALTHEADFAEPLVAGIPSPTDLDRILDMARTEARGFNHSYVGTEHLLLAIVRPDKDVVARLLDSMKVEAAKIATAVEFIIGRGDRPVIQMTGLTPRGKRTMELARRAATRQGLANVGSAQVLEGLVAEGEGIAAGVLEALGVDLDRVRSAIDGIAYTAWESREQSPERIQLLYLDESNRIHLLLGTRAPDGLVTVRTTGLSQVLTASIVSTPAIDRYAATVEFEHLINDDKADEHDLQEFFEAHPEFLLGSEYDALSPQVVLSRVGQDELRPDFLLRPVAGVSWEPALVELKLPSQPIIKPTPRRPGLYAKIHEAVAQLRTYAQFFEEHENREYVRTKLGFTAYEPRLVLVVGRRVDVADERTRASVMRQIRPVELLTYEDLLLRHRKSLSRLQ